MYAAIDKHKSPLTIYQDKLLSEGIDEAELESIKKRVCSEKRSACWNALVDYDVVECMVIMKGFNLSL